MKVTAERLEDHKVVLQMEVPQQEVAKAVKKAHQKLANRINVPGFRKGKVPRNILEQRIGKQALLDEAFDLLAPQAFQAALSQEKVDPVSRPQIDVVTLDEEKDLVFKATVTAKPEIQLGQYKGLSVEKKETEVTDEQVDTQMQGMLNNHAKMVPAEESAVLENGDFAVIDFDGFVDGEAFEGGEGKSYPLQIGSGSFIPGFEEQLIGAKAGEEREVNVTFPAEYHAPNLAGKAALFKVKVNAVKRKEIPALDDAFVQQASAFQTVEELKASIRNRLEESAKQRALADTHAAAIKAASDNCSVDIPPVMVENRISHMIEELDVSLQNRGMKLEQYLQYTKTDLPKLRESYREAAMANVKTDLMLEAVAREEALKVEAADLESEVAAMARAYGATPVQVKKIIQEQGRVGDLAATVLRKKAAKIIVDSLAE